MTTTQWFALLIPFMTACAQLPDEVGVEMNGSDKSDLDTGAYDMGMSPSSCADILAADPTAADGEYTLYVDGDALKPWTAWCHDMSGTPTEYLSLPQNGYKKNASLWTCDGVYVGWESGTPVYTDFTRVRIDPSTLKVSSWDFTFATSSGECHSSADVTQLGWGYTGGCGGNPSGRADIDVTGTPFTIEAGAFELSGWIPRGSIHYSDDSQVVKIRSGGSCGDVDFTSSDGTVQLEYSL